MSTINDVYQRFKSFDPYRVAAQAMAKTGDKLIEINQEQLYHGFGSDGNKIGWYKNPFRSEYSLMKHEKNPLPGKGRPDLYLTGRTYETMEVDFNGDQIEYLMDDPYGLKDRFGETVQGLTVDNKSRHVRENLSPIFINLAKEHLKL